MPPCFLLLDLHFFGLTQGHKLGRLRPTVVAAGFSHIKKCDNTDKLPKPK